MKKHINIIVLIIVGLAAIAVLGYCFWQLQIEQKTFNWQKFGFIHKSTTVDTSDWLTYRTEEYGYEFKYNNKEMIISKEILERGTIGNPSFKINKGGHFAFGVYENDNNLTSRQWLDKQYETYSGGWYGKYVNANINGQKIIKAISDSRVAGDPYQCYIEWNIFSKDKLIFTIAGEFCHTDNYSIDLFEKVVSTFKFIK
jgi:hypothetical protein